MQTSFKQIIDELLEYTDKKQSELKPVAFSGSYNDLTDKPSIPSTAEDVGALPLSGGTLTGKVVINPTVSDETIIIRNDTKRLCILNDSGSGSGGGRLYLMDGADGTDTMKSNFILRAHNGTSYKDLRGYPDGKLTWDNNNIHYDKSSDLYYKAGDVISFTGGTFAGFASNSGQGIYFSISTPKSLKYVSSFTITALKGDIRCNGKYLNASGSSTTTNHYSVCSSSRTVIKIHDNLLYIVMLKSTAMDNVTNNTPITVHPSGGISITVNS